MGAYKDSNIAKLAGTKYDRRIKITEAQRLEIKELRAQGLSYNQIAKRYEVSKKLITMIVNPEIAERNRLASIQRHREGRYKPDKEEWNAIQRELRAYKYKLFMEGKISL